MEVDEDRALEQDAAQPIGTTEDTTAPGHLAGGGGPAQSQRLIPPAEWTRIAEALALTPRELEVAQHIFDSKVERQIALRLGISIHTVHTYVKRMYARLGVNSHRELILSIFAEHLRGKSP